MAQQFTKSCDAEHNKYILQQIWLDWSCSDAAYTILSSHSLTTLNNQQDKIVADVL